MLQQKPLSHNLNQFIILTPPQLLFPHEDHSHKPQHGQENNCQVQESSWSTQALQECLSLLLGIQTQTDSRRGSTQKSEWLSSSTVHVSVNNHQVSHITSPSTSIATTDPCCASRKGCFASLERLVRQRPCPFS